MKKMATQFTQIQYKVNRLSLRDWTSIIKDLTIRIKL